MTEGNSRGIVTDMTASADMPIIATAAFKKLLAKPFAQFLLAKHDGPEQAHEVTAVIVSDMVDTPTLKLVGRARKMKNRNIDALVLPSLDALTLELCRLIAPGGSYFTLFQQDRSTHIARIAERAGIIESNGNVIIAADAMQLGSQPLKAAPPLPDPMPRQTVSGRMTVPEPVTIHNGAHLSWLRNEAIAEATSRGRSDLVRAWEAEDPKRMPPATSMSMISYLFEDVEGVETDRAHAARPFLRPLAAS